MTPAVPTATRPVIDDPCAVDRAARRLADGGIVAHGFANFYAITTRPDAETVRRVNLLKGRPADQVGSITGPPAALAEVWDLDRLPDGLGRRIVLELWDRLLTLGPFGLRGPAAAGVPAHLTSPDAGVLTAQAISPGHACPSNVFLDRARRLAGVELLYVTSANRSRHVTGAADAPAHWRAAGLRAEFGDDPHVLVVEHADEAAARARYPRHRPTSTSILAFHTVARVRGDRRPHLVLERHGSLPAATIRAVLAELGLGLVLGPRARTRLAPYDYPAEATILLQN